MYKQTLKLFTFIFVIATSNPLFAECVAPDDAFFASRNGGCQDLTTGLVWSNAIPAARTKEQSVSHCERLTEGKYSDWRLPRLDELMEAAQNGLNEYGSIHANGNSTSRRWAMDEQGDMGYAVSLGESSVALLSKNTMIFSLCVRVPSEETIAGRAPTNGTVAQNISLGE